MMKEREAKVYLTKREAIKQAARYKSGSLEELPNGSWKFTVKKI
jgi:hypothetical protein